MSNLRQRFERFCFKHRNIGIPNLMLFIGIGSALVYLFTMATGNFVLFDWLRFDHNLILKGQVWRLLSFVLLNNPLQYFGGSSGMLSFSDILWTGLTLFCYYSLGRAMERAWGTFRFNLYYLCGIVLMDAYLMVLGFFIPEYVAFGAHSLPWWVFVSVSYLNMSLFLCYSTMYPDFHFTLFYIIPVRGWVFALVELAMLVYYMYALPGPFKALPLLVLVVYFLFFGKDVVNVLPLSWRYRVINWMKRKPKQHKAKKEAPRVVQFPNGGSRPAPTKADYTHRCTVCGRTDVSNPELEFRYCSRCAGYHCYCEDHISDHEHVTE